MSELEQMIGDVINASAESVRVGMRAERARLLPALQAIFMAFDRAQEDAGAKLPSSLTAAIVAARSVVGPLLEERARGN
jgi:hypothetical protein